MIKRLMHWKSIFSFTIIVLIFLLYQVFRSDFMALPDSGYSRGLLLDKIQIEEGYKNYYAEHFTSVVNDEKLYVLSVDPNGLKVTTYDLSANKLDSFLLSEFKQFTQLESHFEGNSLILNTFDETTRRFISLNIDLDKKSAIIEKEQKIDSYRDIALSPNFILYGTDDSLKILSSDATYKVDTPSYLETLAYTTNTTDESTWIAYTEYIDSQYQLSLKHLDKSFSTLGDYKNYFEFGAGGSFKPHELSMHISNGNLYIISVITDMKSGINNVYLLSSPLNSPKDVQSKLFNAYTYSLQPTFYDEAQQTKLIISSKTNIGKVELGAEGSFQNLVTIDLNLDRVLSLTKSTSPSLSPQMHKIGNYNYLCYLQINQGVGKIMLASDRPELIERSLKSSLMDNFNLLMTTITTFLPLSYIGLIIEAYILTPVLSIVVLVSMFFLTWSERNGNKLLFSAIGIHMLAKNYFIIQYMIKSPDVFSNFPAFLDSPIKLLLWEFALTLSALYCLLQYKKIHSKMHYLYQYFFFNVLDIIFFTMLFTPYYLLR